MQKDYKGDFSAEVLPNDRAADRRRYGMNLVGSYKTAMAPSLAGSI